MSAYVRAKVRHIHDPLSEPDMVAVERAVNGLMPRLRTAERKLVVAILTSRGWSSAEIAKHIGANSRTVQRDRAEQTSARTGQ